MSATLLRRLLALVSGATLIGALVTIGLHGPGGTSSHVSSGRAGSVAAPARAALPGGALTTLPAPTPGSAPAAPTSTVAPAAGAATTAPAAPVTAHPSSPPATVGSPLPTAPGPSGDPGQPAPTAAGHYRYDFTETDSRNGTSHATVTETVTTQAAAAGTTRQEDAYSGSATGPSQQVVEYRPGGLYQISMSFSFGGQSGTCVWDQPLQELAAPLGTGRSWVLQGSCPVTIAGQHATVTLSGTASVTGREHISVGGTAVDVWDVSAAYDATAATALGNAHIHHTETDRVAARLGLEVESTATDAITFPAGSSTDSVHQVLTSLQPT